MDDGVDDYCKLMAKLPSCGVTGVLSTILVKSKGQDAAYIKQLAGVNVKGAQCLGFHFEGPFLALPGAMPPGSLGPADISSKYIITSKAIGAVA